MSKRLHNNCCLCCQDMTNVMPAVCCAQIMVRPAFDLGVL